MRNGDVIAECRAILAAAKPANNNDGPRLAARMPAALDGFRPERRAYEQTLVLNPAPWVRRILASRPR